MLCIIKEVQLPLVSNIYAIRLILIIIGGQAQSGAEGGT